MAKVRRNQDAFGPLEEGFPGDIDKRITIVPLLDELAEAERRVLKLKKWDFKVSQLHTF